MPTFPHLGPVEISSEPQEIVFRSRSKTNDGSWRPDLPFTADDGLKITMRRAPGLTPKGVLKVPLRFQVPAMGEFRRPYRFNWATSDTIAGGQRARPMGAQLLELQIDTLLMDRLAAEASTVVVWDGAPEPQRILKELRYIAGTDEHRRGPAAPFRLTVTQNAIWPEPVISMIAVLTNVEPAQRPGGIATEYLSAAFLQYPPETQTGQRRQQRSSRRHQLTGQISGPNDLHEIAKHYLGRASAWRDIARANGIKGVSPGSEAELAAWAKRHHKTSLVIPPVEMRGRLISAEFEAAP